ncbi:MAG: hypothetical protein L0Z62_13575 [Gemmataceae bacterium]|nr:hypothetical protein [Gemmataceae bacterium]
MGQLSKLWPGKAARRLAVCALVTLGLAPHAAQAQDPADFFRQSCSSCHTIGGGRLTGPDLKGVTGRVEKAGKSRQWLIDFIRNARSVIDSGDPYARQLYDDARQQVMPAFPGLTAESAESLLRLIEAESKLEHSQFAGGEVPSHPFTPADVEKGRAIFMGYRPLKNGGPSCISCHSADGVGALGGGRLGPDLTRVFERLNGRKELAAWLTAPATETMKPVYAKHRLDFQDEILPLVAFFEHTARDGREDSGVSSLSFFLIGLGGAAAGLVAFDAIWRRRFRGVRRQLVHPETAGGHS